MEQQSVLSEFTSDFQATLRGAASANRITEVLGIGTVNLKSGTNKNGQIESSSGMGGSGFGKIIELDGVEVGEMKPLLNHSELESVDDFNPTFKGIEGIGEGRLPDHMLGKNDADPFRDIYGPGRLCHPEEWNNIIKQAQEAGVEVRILDRDIMAYAPRGNVPGQLNIFEDASISALRHEYQHFLDDMAKGYPKLDVTYEFKNRIIMEHSECIV
ncbi:MULTISPECIES: hypothetical protein [unclassified Paenibacillus]|uniref:hypothetical protein n=1 Tax=unclassified Paenibacillus TaxID=185978 RepID=UPI0009F8F873|nr:MULTISPECIES: hypothetical protein [unclassified Paenibacillus]